MCDVTDAKATPKMTPEIMANIEKYHAVGEWPTKAEFRSLMAYVKELEEWKADVSRANRSDAKLALFLYESVRRLRAVVASASILRDAKTQFLHDLAARAFDRKLAALEPGDLAE